MELEHALTSGGSTIESTLANLRLAEGSVADIRGVDLVDLWHLLNAAGGGVEEERPQIHNVYLFLLLKKFKTKNIDKINNLINFLIFNW
jgi:hypothetical protein